MRRTVILFLLFSFLFSLLPLYSSASGLTRVYVDGVKLGVYAKVEDGTAYLPAHSLAEALGISLSWSGKTRIVKINGNVIATSPLEVDGKLYLPVESIASAAGATVEWDGNSKVIRVSRGEGGKAAAALKPPVSVEKTSPKPAVAVAPKAAYTPAPVVRSTPEPVSTVTAPRPSISYVPSGKSGSQTSGVTRKPPSSYSGQPTRSAYPTDQPRSNAPLRPKDAPPTMPSNLSLPPMSATGAVSSPNQTFSSASPFIPKSETNQTFRVTVTNLEFVDSIKDYYKPKPGYRFVVVYLSQQNISEEVQIYTGRFSLLDQDNHSYDYVEGLSNFWLVILKPGGINFGYLVFEVPGDAKPMKVVLHGLNQAPLSVALR